MLAITIYQIAPMATRDSRICRTKLWISKPICFRKHRWYRTIWAIIVVYRIKTQKLLVIIEEKLIN